GQAADLRYELACDPVFRQVAGGTRLPGLVHLAHVRAAGEDQDARLRIAGPNLLRGIDAVHHGHADVHDDHVRLELLRQGDAVFAVVGSADDDDSVLAREHGLDHFDEEGLVVDDQDPDFSCGLRDRSSFRHVSTPFWRLCSRIFTEWTLVSKSKSSSSPGRTGESRAFRTKKCGARTSRRSSSPATRASRKLSGRWSSGGLPTSNGCPEDRLHPFRLTSEVVLGGGRPGSLVGS